MDPATEFGEWECSVCTLINKKNHNRCTECRTPKPTKNSRDYALGGLLGRTRSIVFSSFFRRPTSGTHAYSDEGRNTISQGLVEEVTRSCTLMDSERKRGCKEKSIKMHTEEMRFVLIGKTGTGKSATGNTILGRMIFESVLSGSSVTSKCAHGFAHRMNRKFVLIDTPGLFDTGMSNEVVTKEIVKCIAMSSPGPHAFLLTVNVVRFTKEEQDTVAHFVNHFGEDLYKYLIVVFTRADDLERDNANIKDFVNRSPPALKEILDRCGGRYIPFNNKDSESGKEQQVQKLVALVDDVVNQNGGQCYTNDMYAEAERTLKRREEELKQQLKIEEQILIDSIRQEYENQLKDQDEMEREYKIKLQNELKIVEAKYQKDKKIMQASGDSVRKERDDMKTMLQDKERELQEKEKHYERRIERIREEFKQEIKNSASRIYERKERKERKEIKEMNEKLLEYEKKIKDLEKNSMETKSQMEQNYKRKEANLREEFRRKTEAQALRDVSRIEVQEEKGLLSKVWDGLKSVGKAIKNVFTK